MNDRNGHPIRVGDCVIWHDPDEDTRDLSRIWAIDDIKDGIARISDDFAEVGVCQEELELYF